MKSQIYIAIILLSIANVTKAQRYQEAIFENSIATNDVVFSTNVPQPVPSESSPILPLRSNVKEHETILVDLRMDIHEPAMDEMDKRPTLLLCHGGGFTEGSKGLGDIKTLANTYAKKGYVVAAIDYRLGINVTDSRASQRALYRGIQDSRTAIRFLRANASTYGIDQDKIFIIGVSSGGMIALHNNYLDETERTEGTRATSYQYSPNGFDNPETFSIPDLGCLDCIGGNQEFSGKANATVAFAGALGSVSFIDGASNFPTLLFHSRDDTEVPYECGKPYGGEQTQLEKVFGSKAISDEAIVKGATIELVSFDDRGHNVHTPDGTAIYPEIETKITSFLFDILSHDSPTLASSNQIKNSVKDFTIYPNPVKRSQPLHISSAFSKEGNVLIRFFDIIGHVVYESSYSNLKQFTLENQQENIFHGEGMYICQIQIGDKIISKKIVVTN